MKNFFTKINGYLCRNKFRLTATMFAMAAGVLYPLPNSKVLCLIFTFIAGFFCGMSDSEE